MTWHNTKLTNVSRSTRRFVRRKNPHSPTGYFTPVPSSAVFRNSCALKSSKTPPGQPVVHSLLYFFSGCTELSTSACPIAPRSSLLHLRADISCNFFGFVGYIILCIIHESNKTQFRTNNTTRRLFSYNSISTEISIYTTVLQLAQNL